VKNDFPIYTILNKCQDCYKCVRNCPCKAIQVKDGIAKVIPEYCVSCGICYRVCPASAKKIRDDLPRVKYLVSQSKKVYVSLAPSWMNYFGYYSINETNIVGALKKLGFAGVSETALGAQQVSALTARKLSQSKNELFISSACPAVVEYIKKYLPEFTGNITPFLSPLLTHCKILKQFYGNDAHIVFIGPCIAKKNEADSHSEFLDIALTFDDILKWFKEENIIPEAFKNIEDTFELTKAEEGNLYPIEGGMIDTLKNADDDKTIYLRLSGIQNIINVLKKHPKQFNQNIFIEALACSNGCINGPALNKNGMSLEDMVIISAKRNKYKGSSVNRPVTVVLNEEINSTEIKYETPDEQLINEYLQMIGKYSKEDELNCSGCGYETCREFAKAMISKKGEPEMCVSYLKKLSQKKANALIKYIPAGVVIVDKYLKIIECNYRFAKMFGEDAELAFNAKPGLKDVDLKNIINFIDFFKTALETGGDIERRNFHNSDKILDIDIFNIEERLVIGAIVQDVTKMEFRRERIAEKAREVIMKNIMTVQKIANCLGEHMADTEIILNEVANGFDNTRLDSK